MKMKDILITVKQQKREFLIWLASFALAFLLNVFAISAYGTDWSELGTQLVWVLVLSFLIYVLFWIPRIIWLFMASRKRKQ